MKVLRRMLPAVTASVLLGLFFLAWPRGLMALRTDARLSYVAMLLLSLGLACQTWDRTQKKGAFVASAALIGHAVGMSAYVLNEFLAPLGGEHLRNSSETLGWSFGLVILLYPWIYGGLIVGTLTALTLLAARRALPTPENVSTTP